MKYALCALLLIINMPVGFSQTSESLQATVADESHPLSPSDSLASIHVRDGFEVQLVASEPQVLDPVAIDWGPDGRLWVVEMADYPLGIDGNGKAGGRVRVLEDQDDDGYYETSNVFAEDLSFPNGILVWNKGILVTAAPNILYLEDSTGDGRADVQRVLFTGFLEGNQQLRVNGLRLGLDNWVYCASGSHHAGYGSENKITSTITGETHQVGSRDFRIRPDTGEIDPQSGPSQYGRNRDEWGNWFGVQNSRPLWHYVLADQDIRRNPHFAPPDPIVQVVTPLNPLVYPAKAPQKRFHSFNESGRFTSACSGMIYCDDRLFARKDHEQNAFTCEPFHNLVQHNIIYDDGVSFGFRRDPAESVIDFFASEDRWCRPVMVRTGPDGGLWVVDMYRYMIEHPDWLPPEGKEELRPHFRSGEDRGRIYRIVPKGSEHRIATRLAGLSTTELVAALDSANVWQRDSAQQLLVRKRDLSVCEALGEMVSNCSNPLARLHAMCTLDGLEALTSSVLKAGLSDAHAGVRRQAVRLATSELVSVDSLVPLAADPDLKVRLQLAATLGAFEGPLAASMLAKLATDSAGEPFIVANVMSSLNANNITEVLFSFVRQASQQPEPQAVGDVRLQLFSQVAAMGDAGAIDQVVKLACTAENDAYQPWQLAGLARLLDGFRHQDVRVHLSETSLASVDELIAKSMSIAGDESNAASVRMAAFDLMLRHPKRYSSELRFLAELLVPQSAVDMQLAVIRRLAEQSDGQVAVVLLAGWRSYSPLLKARVLDVVSSRSGWAMTLLAQIKSNQVSLAEISPAMRQRLLSTKDTVLAAEWDKLFATAGQSDRKQTIEDYQPVLGLEGDAGRGKIAFQKNCSACHRLGDVGHDVGPNLTALTDKSSVAMLTAILDPNASVEAKYLTYGVLTVDGRLQTGMLDTETGSSITLLSTEGKRETILRSD
ncbi:MAG: c-type cytochrome, partial [Pirellulaceae bacterium]|nr:c-type cytochrome [Pirellulaceae bacterium]